MASTQTFNTFFVVCFTSVLISTASGLKCYDCQSYGSEPCPDEDLKECPNVQAYDRCMVKMQKSSANEPMQVIRECALAPCHFRDKAFDNIFNLRKQCDLSKGSFECVYCCKEDGCNRDYGLQLTPMVSLIVSTLVSTVFLTYF